MLILALNCQIFSCPGDAKEHPRVPGNEQSDLGMVNGINSFEDGLFPVHICVLYHVLFGFTGNLQLSPYAVTSIARQYPVYS